MNTTNLRVRGVVLDVNASMFSAKVGQARYETPVPAHLAEEVELAIALNVVEYDPYSDSVKVGNLYALRVNEGA